MTGIGAIATSPAISTLIAAALYIATYLSFLRLLRYPRNWYLPTLPASLATAGLAAITVAQVSVSSDGLDLMALVVLAGFIAVLFGIIAAPAGITRAFACWDQPWSLATSCPMSSSRGSWLSLWRSKWHGFYGIGGLTGVGYIPLVIMTCWS
jgi:hypothetical protein